MAETTIEWTDRVWNPVTGCTKVSAGCKHCYAETIADRFWATQYPLVLEHFADGSGRLERPRKFTDVMTHADRLNEPLKWRKPAKVFVNSMSDLFHEDVAFPFIAAVFAVMAATPRHAYQVLTKRAERMREFFEWVNHADGTEVIGSGPLGDGPPIHVRRMLRVDEDIAMRFHEATEDGWDLHACLNNDDVWPLPNVWLGVSCENQEQADARIPLLLQTPAAMRFISAEPLLGPIDLAAVPAWLTHPSQWPALQWVIAGGESGPGARPMDLAWARSLVQQCHAAGVPLFYKQGGSAHRCEHSSKGGCLDCAPADLRVRQWPRLTEGLSRSQWEGEANP
jgi:protein gp37